MSSSKIIKQAFHDSTGISEFSFRSIGQSDSAPNVVQSEGHFVPMGLFQGIGPIVSGQNGSGDTGPSAIEISEDELNQRIGDAFNDGLKEGKELAERGLINVFRALRASSEAIHNLRDKILRESEDELINLVMLVARKVIIQEINQDHSIVAGVVQAALADLSSREEITVRINPDDYLLVTSGRDALLHAELLNERLLLKPDPSVAAGFCLVETEMGTIDASLDGQLEQIYRSLLEQRTTSVVDES
ncbi:MAG: FliH/SctL family protein [Desulfuromonadaceae bacterium]|nr:FliH/SctL family protein [Desulfuromonadaceae bacterium]